MTDPITRLNAALEGRYRVERELAGGNGTSGLGDPLSQLGHTEPVTLPELEGKAVGHHGVGVERK